MMKDKSQKVRFIIVGGTNTLIDFGLLFLLRSLGLPTIPANIISTSAAFCFSFFANKKFTFQTNERITKREVILFISVTLFGLWVIQAIIIQLVSAALTGFRFSDEINLLIAKVIATGATLVWNYVLYSRVVFRPAKVAEDQRL